MHLQVRASPHKKRAVQPTASKAKKKQTQYPSTNVSSPIRCSSPTKSLKQKRLKQYAYHEEEDEEEDDTYFEPPRHAIRKNAAHGYEADGFVVADGADGDEDFAPIRVAKTSKPTRSRTLGAPITVDQRTGDLNEYQNDVLRDFMDGARSLRKSIMANHGYRQAIFTDTVLREMGIELPRNLDEMRLLNGIRPEMVDRWGKRFLPLINNTRECYAGNLPVPRVLVRSQAPRAQSTRVVHEVSDDDDDDEEVEDLNHQLVVDLCSDTDAPQVIPVEDDESDYSYDDGNPFDDDEEDDDDDGAVHTSHHFSQNQDPEVAQFNNRYSQLGPMVAAPAPKSGRASSSRAGSKAPGGKFAKRNWKRNSSSSYGGVKKRAPKTSGSRASTSASASRGGSSSSGRRGGGASANAASTGRNGGRGGGWSSVMAMPT